VRPFGRYGLEHGITLALLAAVALLLVAVARRSRTERGRIPAGIRFPLAALLVGGLGFALVDALPIRGLDWLDVLPLDLCDLAVLVAVWALLTGSRLACELVYFWGLTGTLIAMLTPDVDAGFPDTRCVSFFALHGAVAVAAVVMAFGAGVRPRPGANLRVFWITNAYALLVGLVDAAAGKNYLYLCRKPSQPTIMDAMGPWPWYILAADALAFVLFWALMAPFRGRPRSEAG
jgi:hypothetical integral membrane protein (TIGR02206 family)